MVWPGPLVRSRSGGRAGSLVRSRSGGRVRWPLVGFGRWSVVASGVARGWARLSQEFWWVRRSERTVEKLVPSDLPMVGLIGIEIQSPIQRVPPLS